VGRPKSSDWARGLMALFRFTKLGYVLPSSVDKTDEPCMGLPIGLFGMFTPPARGLTPLKLFLIICLGIEDQSVFPGAPMGVGPLGVPRIGPSRPTN